MWTRPLKTLNIAVCFSRARSGWGSRCYLWNVSLANKRCFAVSDGGPTTGRGIGYHGGSLSPATGGVRPTQRDCQPPSHQSQYRKGLGKGTETGGGFLVQPTILKSEFRSSKSQTNRRTQIKKSKSKTIWGKIRNKNRISNIETISKSQFSKSKTFQ